MVSIYVYGVPILTMITISPINQEQHPTDIGWHHQLNGHEFEQAPGVGDGQGSLAYCDPWVHKELDTAK